MLVLNWYSHTFTQIKTVNSNEYQARSKYVFLSGSSWGTDVHTKADSSKGMSIKLIQMPDTIRSQ